MGSPTRCRVIRVHIELGSMTVGLMLGQLESLDLSRGAFEDEEARAMLDNKSAYSHLGCIDLNFVAELQVSQ